MVRLFNSKDFIAIATFLSAIFWLLVLARLILTCDIPTYLILASGFFSFLSYLQADNRNDAKDNPNFTNLDFTQWNPVIHKKLNISYSPSVLFKQLASLIRQKGKMVRVISSAIAVIAAIIGIGIMLGIIPICKKIPPPSVGIEYLLDTSDSMTEQINGLSRYEIAITAMREIGTLSHLETSSVWLSLRVAGGGDYCNQTSQLNSGANLTTDAFLSPLHNYPFGGTNAYELGIDGIAEDFAKLRDEVDVKTAILFLGSVDNAPCIYFDWGQRLRVLKHLGINATVCVFTLDIDPLLYEDFQARLSGQGFACVYNLSNSQDISNIVIGIIEQQLLIKRGEIEVLVSPTPAVYLASETPSPTNTSSNTPLPSPSQSVTNTATEAPSPTLSDEATETPSITPNGVATAMARQGLTATSAVLSTQSVQTEQINTAIRIAAITQTFVARSTNTPTNEPTATETPTSDPSPTVDVYLATVQQARIFSETLNSNWQPIVHDFGDGVEMMLVPVGCFDMGNDSGAYYMDGPSLSGVGYAGRICFDEPFWIDRTEVTQADFSNLGGTKASPNYFSGDNRPVEMITWLEARDFCENERDGRLPTEAEWEYAARGVESFLFPWGNSFLADNIIYGANSGGQTHDVGTRPDGVSWVGTLDMLGNVQEWTSSLFFGYPYPTDANGLVTDDGREDRNSTGHRTQKGGAWCCQIPTLVHSASRVYSRNNEPTASAGFRCARSIN